MVGLGEELLRFRLIGRITLFSCSEIFDEYYLYRDDILQEDNKNFDNREKAWVRDGFRAL